MQTNIDNKITDFKKTTIEKRLICIICNEKLPVNNNKHTCSYRTDKTICINLNKKIINSRLI